MQALKGVIASFLLGLIIILLAFVLFGLAFVRYIAPVPSWRRRLAYALNDFPMLWTDINTWVLSWFGLCHVDVQGDLEQLDPNRWYLMTANHSSWTDILLLHRVFNHRIPVLKFFMKQQIKWVPFLGWGCWLIGYPFMKRYSKQTLQKKPHLKGKDYQTTQKMCQRYKQGKPNTIISFAEGTRYTKAKAKRQNSPYRHLLKPRAGGLGYTLTLMQDKIDEFIDVTIIYHDCPPTFWDFICGRIQQVTMIVDLHQLGDELKGDYQNDRAFRSAFQNWLNQIWEQKDQRLAQYLESNESKS